MTVVAYRNGIIAADGLCVSGFVKTDTAVKVCVGADGMLYGVSGSAAACSDFIYAVSHGLPRPKPEKAEGDHGTFIAMAIPPEMDRAYVLTWQGREVHRLRPPGTELHPNDERLDYFAIGGGSEVAMGAFYAGADAAQAVAAAKAHSHGCGGSTAIAGFPRSSGQ